MKQIIIHSIAGVLLVSILFFSFHAYRSAKKYEEKTALLVAQMSAKSLVTYRAQELVEELSFGFYKNKKHEMLQEIEEKQHFYKTQSRSYTLYAISALLILLLGYFVISLRMFTFFGAITAGVMLFFGFVSPMLMITIHKKVEYLGDVVLSFESKSIIGSIAKLFENGDIAVAIVILFFSILIPIVKVLSILFISLFTENRFAHSIIEFFKVIGKWSMIDVFVVATFLAYLTVDKGDVSRAEIEVGFYFFLVYVIVSMLVSLGANRMLHQVKDS
ncbi:MAG: paraquat-inducible protein A [Sulfurovum sp.]|nr:paraquat-inducible protein A [Sulfurovum sp.]MCB4746391.1 paraquat-inducible protein A [Sulfurovum sp.]MCB4749178.1 paraquat-inducible protein A [Sulfurovum sp.]MCB4752997.1 paraquat-inducible protein A [Sulfurovum sp.]MCB4761135.1 paraquat-inducible protein A [Sulfurovum sp.]